ncbi:MAG: tetratricopeptide repeat protein, partial [Holophagales bacterium]|nr:tetratricopeptide repeat protein [Holophagales bacterium]
MPVSSFAASSFPASGRSRSRGAVWGLWLLVCGTWVNGMGMADPGTDPGSGPPGHMVLEVGRRVPVTIEAGDGAELAEIRHRYRLPAAEPGIPWRLVVEQRGIDVRVVELSDADGPSPDGPGLDYQLDRFETEVFRLSAGLEGFEIRPDESGERVGSYVLLLELPVGEDPDRRRLESSLTEAARVPHGGEATAVRGAAELYEAAAREMAARPAGPASAERARALLGAANHRRVLGEGERAVDLYRRAAEIWRQRWEPAWLAASLVGVGQSERRLGNLDAARAALGEALELWRAEPDRETETAQTEGNLGLVAHVDGDLIIALEHYGRALERHRHAGRRLEVANMLLNTGIVHSQLGDAGAALDHQEASLEIFRRARDRRGELDARNSLAVLHRRMGDMESALFHFGAARVLASKLGDRRLEARAINNRGHAYLVLGDLERAGADLELARRFGREAGDVRIRMLCGKCKAEPGGSGWHGRRPDRRHEIAFPLEQ